MARIPRSFSFPSTPSTRALARLICRSRSKPSHGPPKRSGHRLRITSFTRSDDPVLSRTCHLGARALGYLRFSLDFLPCPNCIRRRMHSSRLPHSCHTLWVVICTVPVFLLIQTAWPTCDRRFVARKSGLLPDSRMRESLSSARRKLMECSWHSRTRFSPCRPEAGEQPE